MKKPDKKTTFKFFTYKWERVPKWAKVTESIYRKWYLDRYGYNNMEGLKKFLADKSAILEAGCGLARDSKMFAEANPHATIFAVDQSPAALKVAARTLKKFKNCRVARADITNFSTGNTFDFISCDQVMHHTPEPGQTLKYLFEKLNKGGVINFSLARTKNKFRDLADDLIMEKAASLSSGELWKFSRIITRFAKALYDLKINNVKFEGRTYENLQRYVHNNLFRAWYSPEIDFELSVSSNYDWFSNNPRFHSREVKRMIKGSLVLAHYKVLRFYEDDATVSVTIRKLN
ncbi:MAG: class I SAM-dependent methyltransferase [Candidatus Azambacteria bacterium]|nr:class I SAM-dependent methyltransferase [Candidatus Azambacteria bacterium]